VANPNRHAPRCETCGVTVTRQRPKFAGTSQSACPKCGSCRSHWAKRRVVIIDHSLPTSCHHRLDNRKQALRVRMKRELEATKVRLELEEQRRAANKNTRTLADKQDADNAWQAAHERKMAALRRLGLDVRADNDVDRCEFIGQRGLLDAEASRGDPMRELVDAARAGDEYAVYRATELFGDSWSADRKQRTG
jgi:hypothetical protein